MANDVTGVVTGSDSVTLPEEVKLFSVSMSSLPAGKIKVILAFRLGGQNYVEHLEMGTNDALQGVVAKHLRELAQKVVSSSSP